MTASRLRFTSALIVILVLTGLLAGCSSIAKGTVQALLAGNASDSPDSGECSIRGSAFTGLASYLERQQAFAAANGNTKRPVLKVLKVHGTSRHEPGYSTRLAENLAHALHLNVIDATTRQIDLSAPLYAGMPLGSLRITRFADRAAQREMLFYELTWSDITEPEKAAIAYDDSGEYSFRRADLNNQMKKFFNSHLSDPLIYLGDARDKVQLSVIQSMCWMMSRDWIDLPDKAATFCDAREANFLTELDDDYVFITHSLGSGIVTDAMGLLATIIDDEIAARRGRNLAAAADAMRNKKFPIFMLANQLPLLQLGQPKRATTMRRADYCTAAGKFYDRRIFQELALVAFSDPNDILSYAVPANFLQTYMDPRLCPSLVNVVLNVAEVVDLLGLGSVANPLRAHTGYDNDDRVVALISRGIGNKQAMPMLDDRCDWLESR